MYTNVLLKSLEVEEVFKVDISLSTYVALHVRDAIGTKVFPAKTGHQECRKQHYEQELTGEGRQERVKGEVNH